MAGAVDYSISAPSVSSMYSTPYGVLTSYNFLGHTYPGKYKDEVNVHINDYYGGMEAAISLIISVIEDAANNEESRELQLLNSYINLIPQDTNLRKDFETLIQNKQYSQAFDTLQKVMNDMYDFNKTLQENQQLFTQINDLFLNKNIIHALADELGKTDYITTHANFNSIDLANTTGSQIIEKVVEKALEQATQKLDTSKQIEYYKNFLRKVKSFMEKIFIDSYGSNVLNESLLQLENNKKIQVQRKAKGGKHANDPLNQLIWNQIWGLLNGMPNEITLDLNGGVQTGTITGNRGYIKGDAYTLMDAKQEIVLKEGSQEKLDFLKITKKNELETFLSRGAFKDNFIIITSAKDQSLSSDFNNQFSKNNIKFAEQSSLNERIANIKEFGIAADAMGSGISDLIFALVNLEKDMVCAGEINTVKQALGALCANWMFDDLGDVVTNVNLTNNASKICVYYINGWYYTLSDILRRTVNKVRGKKPNDLVSVKLSIPKSSSYGAAAKEVPEGIERWEATRTNIMSKTTLGFELRVKNLFDAFY